MSYPERNAKGTRVEEPREDEPGEEHPSTSKHISSTDKSKNPINRTWTHFNGHCDWIDLYDPFLDRF
jgi:hypothetical protein